MRHSSDSGMQGFDRLADESSETAEEPHDSPEVNDLLNLLPEKERLVMALWLASNDQDQEIADRLECSVSTVRRRRKRSIAILRDHLDD